MRLKAKKILAILLMLSIVLTALPAPVMAAPGGDIGDNKGGSSGATYNEGTGSADIVTGTASGGADKFASRNQWAITEKNGTFTRIINKHIKRYLSNILTLS
jgi:hypothetical protein